MVFPSRPDRARDATLKMARPFIGKPRYTAIVHAAATEAAELYDAVNEFLSQLNVATTTSLWVLGRLGLVVGMPNLGWDLETLRAYVLAKIEVNKSFATLADLLATGKLLASLSVVKAASLGHRTARLTITGPDKMTETIQWQLIKDTVDPAVTVEILELDTIREPMLASHSSDYLSVTSASGCGHSSDLALGAVPYGARTI